ncbi:MAG: DUF3830 family protein [Bacteroidia bacterium]|nr:DUF3830 family protein [Bacteroidia bacterium]
MQGFLMIPSGGTGIRFRYYTAEAPITSEAFEALLPVVLKLRHARVSGQEIWTNEAPPLDIIQENASVLTEPGEVVYGPAQPLRNPTANCMGVYYGAGRGLDACNIFARVWEEDMPLLQALGEVVWLQGEQWVRFEKM